MKNHIMQHSSFGHVGPINAKMNKIMNLNIHDYPHFLDSILEAPFFDPANLQRGDIKSHLYDDIDHEKFSRRLQSLTTKNSILIEVFERKKKNKKVRQYDSITFQRKNHTLLVKILQVLLDSVEITTVWNYKLIDFFVFDLQMDEDKRFIQTEVLTCIHRPSRAYAKVISVTFIYDTQEDDINVLQAKLIGTVPQQHIFRVHGSSMIADDAMFRLPDSIPLFND